MQEDSVSPARERLGYKPRDDDDVQKKNLSILSCLCFAYFYFFLYLSFPSCPSKNTPCATDLKTNRSDIKR